MRQAIFNRRNCQKLQEIIFLKLILAYSVAAHKPKNWLYRPSFSRWGEVHDQEFGDFFPGGLRRRLNRADLLNPEAGEEVADFLGVVYGHDEFAFDVLREVAQLFEVVTVEVTVTSFF